MFEGPIATNEGRWVAIKDIPRRVTVKDDGAKDDGVKDEIPKD